jgi:hypothetical protein
MAKCVSYFERNDVKVKLSLISDKRVFLGFDAFIDFVAFPIKQGNAIKALTLFETIDELCSHMQKYNDETCSIELLESNPKAGGNMAITANAISSFGIKTYCVGSFGYPNINPVFCDMAKFCELISVCDPGEAIILEFKNGKVIFGMNRDVSFLDWNLIKERAGLSRIIDSVNLSELVFMLNWSELPGSTGIFKGMRDEVFPNVTGNKRLFIDISDCSRRKKEEILEILHVIENMPENVKVSFSMNKKEERIICSILGINSDDKLYRGKKLIEKLRIDSVFFHSRQMNVFVTAKDDVSLTPEICLNPKINVGAGDNFNAGAAIGMMMDLSAADILGLASEAARYYIENGKSYNLREENI